MHRALNTVRNGTIRDKKYTCIFSWRPGHLDPCLWEERTRAEHEDDVEHGVDRVLCHVAQSLRRRQVVAQPADWVGPGWTATPDVSPGSKQVYEEVSAEFSC